MPFALRAFLPLKFIVTLLFLLPAIVFFGCAPAAEDVVAAAGPPDPLTGSDYGQLPSDTDYSALLVTPELSAGSVGTSTAAAPATLSIDDFPPIPESGTLKPGDADFILYFDKLYEDKEKYYGRRIELSGMVLHDAALAADEFLIGRNLLWCCEDDSYFVGFLAFGLPQLPEDGASLRLEGWLEPRSYTDSDTGRSFDVPAIRIDLARPDYDFALTVYPIEGTLD